MSGSELGIVDDEEFILPEQIRCTTPTQVGLALKRPLKQSGTFSEEQINGKDDENQHVSDWQHDDLDPVEQKSHHFPPLDYYIVFPNSMFPFSSDQTTHPNHIPLHPPPIPSAPTSASSFDNLNGEESVEELLMFDSPLTGHEMRNQKQKQRHELKKSFMVEFTSEEEYEKFLRFKNKLSSSSCCSSPTISLGSPTPQLNDDDDVDDDEVVVVEDKKGDCPKDGHSVAKTNSLANGIGNDGEENFISSPESSSYLATLTEEDEDVEEEEDDERTANGDGVKLIPHSSQLTQGIDANCYEIKQIASENGTNQLDYLGASADSRQYPHKADDDDFGDDFNDDEELGLPEAEQQHGEKWKKKRNKDEEESAKGGGGSSGGIWREESSRLKTGECALNSSTADARPMEPSPLKHGSFGGEIRSSDGAEDFRDRLVSDDSGNDDYDDVNHSIEKSATSQDNCFGEFANHQNIPQNPVLSLEKGVQCQESIWARALYDEKSIQVPSVSPQKSSTGSPLTSSDQVEESYSEEAEEIAKGRPGNENLSDGSNRCNSGFVVTESRDCDVVVKGVGRTSVQDYCPTCESDLSDCCSSCCCCSSVLCLNNSEVRSPPCDRARLNESNCCRVVVKRGAEELHNNKEGPCENNNSGSGSEDDDEDIVVATADDSNDNLAFFSCCNSPAPLGAGAGAASPEFPSFSSTCNNSKRTAGNNSTSGSSGGGSSSLNCSLVCDVSGVRSVGGKSETDSDNNGCIEVHVRANINVELSSSLHEKEETVVPSAFSRVVGKSARNIGKQVQYSRSDCLEGDLSNNSNSDKDIIIFHDDNKNEEGSDFESGGSDLKRVPFTSSNSSLNSSLSSDIFQNCNSSFEASNRLKRLEERLKKFQYTKKLLRDDRGTTTTSNCGNPIRDRDGDDDEEERLLIENISKCLQESYSKNKSSFKRTDESPNLISSPPTTTTNRSSGLLKGLDLCNNNFQTLLTSATDVIEDIERDRDKDLERKTTLDSNNNRVEQQFVEREEDFKEFFPNSTYFPSDYFALQTSCVFNVDELPTYPTSAPVLECYDELEDDIETEEDDEDGPENSQSDGDDEDTECDCVIEAYPFIGFLDKSVEPRNLIQSIEMRENTGPLRGLLKKPNRPPPQRKNRVVFDETRNEFFDADYIILIREDCPYDEEDEEPCTCGEHELVRLCCEEGCQCPGYTDDCKTPQSPKFAPPIEFVDSATLSPPEGYKDGGALSNVLGGALGGHVFGAQHIQQLQVIQRLQQQRAAMLAARNNSAMASGQPAVVDGGNLKGQATQQQPAGQQQQQPQPQQQQQMSQVCTECAECAECAAKQMQEDDCHSPCPEDVGLAVPHVAIVPIKTSSPERRITSQKEIVAGEERPKYLAIKQLENQASQVAPDGATGLNSTAAAASASTATSASMAPGVAELQTAGGVGGGVAKVVAAANNLHDPAADPANIAGILKGGKLWKSEQTQCDETTNITSDEEGGNGKRSVRFTEVVKKMSDTERDDSCDGIESDLQNGDESDIRPMEILPMKKQSSLFHNALRPNSAVRQLFPTAIATDTPLLTHESLRAFEDSKRITLSTATVAPIATHSDSETDTIRRTIERNALRRSLIKYEPKKMQKPTQRIETSLEERIRLLTCDIDEPSDDSNKGEGLERRDSPAGEENPQQAKYLPDKSYSPSSSASSSSSGSQSAYRKITDIFNKDRRQERILEADENPIVIVPQDCRCPAAPDLGMGVQMPQTHTQVHQTPPRQNESRRQFLSTLAPLTACVAGQRDDMSYYTLAAGDRNSTASSHCSEYSLGDIEAVLHDDESKKVAPDVIAGTPGQETDELAAFAQQEASRTERIKKRYSGDSGITSNSSNSKSSSSINATLGAASDEDDEQNDYGFNKRPSVRGIKPRFGSTNEILQQMQAQLATPGPLKVQTQVPGAVAPAPPPQAQMIQKVQTVVQQQQIATAAGGQHPGQWGYYPLGEHHPQQQLQRTQSTSGVPDGNFYAHLPAHVRHSSFHGHHEEATIYQNCHSVTVEHPVANHPYGHYARSPTRRPESPPPLRNYHQTMVLIPYNTETYAHYATNEHVPVQQIRRLEYQQVTQQTIRVPVGYPISGQMLHVVAGRATPTTATTATTTTNGQLPDYATLPRPRQMSTGNYAYVSGGGVGVGAGVGEKGVENNVKFIERGAPEGAASVQQVDGGKTNVSPSQQPNVIPQQQQNPANPGNVFYAMNV